MNRFAALMLASTIAAGAASHAQAAGITYTSYTVLNEQNVHITDTAISPAINNEYVGAGEILLNTSSGVLGTWCFDIQDVLQNSGTFGTMTTLTGTIATNLNKLLSNVNPTATANSSAALQVAIWMVEYSTAPTFTSPLTVTADNSAVNTLANSYISSLAGWSANPNMVLTQISQPGNQSQGYLVASNGALPVGVPEPASMVLIAGAIAAVAASRRKATSVVAA